MKRLRRIWRVLGIRCDKMEEELLIYQQNVINTYLYFIKENISLIRSIYDEKGKLFESYNPKQKWKLYSSRAKHLQIMILIGLTTEHLIKIILLKRGFVLNASEVGAKFQEAFIQELVQKNKTELTQEEMDETYSKAKNNLIISFKKPLKSFDECISLFIKSNAKDYCNSLGTYILNPNPEVYDGDSYLEYYKQIKPEEALKVIQKMRNSYSHLAKAREEQQGVVWYLFNFLVWLCKKEYPDFFEDLEYIGSKENRRLFEHE